MASTLLAFLWKKPCEMAHWGVRRISFCQDTPSSLSDFLFWNPLAWPFSSFLFGLSSLSFYRISISFWTFLFFEMFFFLFADCFSLHFCSAWEVDMAMMFIKLPIKFILMNIFFTTIWSFLLSISIIHIMNQANSPVCFGLSVGLPCLCQSTLPSCFSSTDSFPLTFTF